MPVVAFRKKIVRRRRRRFIPRKRIFTAKSLTPRRTIYIHKGRFRLFKHRKPMPRVFRRFNTYVLYTGTGRGGMGRSYSQKYTPKARIKTKDVWKPKWNVKKEWNKKKKTWVVEDRPIQKPKFGEAFIRERKKSFKEELKPSKPIKKKYNKGWFKKGEKPPQRRYTNYGVMRRLGPDPVIVIYPTVELAKAIKKGQGGHGKGWMGDVVKSSLDILYGNLVNHAEMIINLYVPKDTGDLRASMMKEIKRRRRAGYRLEVRVGTPVMGRNMMTYANPVNHMPESMIQHDANKRSAKTRKMLFDPKAQKGWYELIRMKLNNYLTKSLIPAFYQNLIEGSIRKQGVGMIPKSKMPKSYKLKFELETKRTMHYDDDYVRTKRDTYETELKMKRVQVPLNRGRMTTEEWRAMLKEKANSAPERFAKYRQKVEKARSANKLKSSPYKLTDVKKWFKIELPFKR